MVLSYSKRQTIKEGNSSPVLVQIFWKLMATFDRILIFKLPEPKYLGNPAEAEGFLFCFKFLSE